MKEGICPRGGNKMNSIEIRIIQKILAILIIISMTMANLTMVGIDLVSYAADFIER